MIALEAYVKSLANPTARQIPSPRLDIDFGDR